MKAMSMLDSTACRDATRMKKSVNEPETTHMSEEEIKNNCYMCSLNGRPAAECCIEMQPGSKPAAFLNEHGRGRHGVILCPWFGRKFPDDAERDTKAKMARRARKQADSQAIQAAQYSARKKQKL